MHPDITFDHKMQLFFAIKRTSSMVHASVYPTTLSSRATNKDTFLLTPHPCRLWPLKLMFSHISLGQLCNDDCKIYLDKTTMQVTKDNKLVLTGTHNIQDGLWDVSLTTLIQTQQSTSAKSTSSTQVANVIIRKKQTLKDLANYLHAACGSPPVSTFLKAIKAGLLQSWPGIELIKESDLSASIATAKGHLDQERKIFSRQSLHPLHLATRSILLNKTPCTFPKTLGTSNEPHVLDEAPDTDSLPQHGPMNKSQDCYAVINQFNSKAYSDLTGQYPHISLRGNQYILIVYDYDSSGILVEPLKNRQAAESTCAWLAIHARLERHGNAPKLYILDNEVSYEFKAALRKKNITFQLVPPNVPFAPSKTIFSASSRLQIQSFQLTNGTVCSHRPS